MEYKYFFLLGVIAICLVSMFVMREKEDEALVNAYRDMTLEKQRLRSA